MARTDKEGAIHLLFDSEDGPRYAKSTDNGVTFGPAIAVVGGGPRVPGLEFFAWDMAVGKGGRVHVAMGTNAWKLKLPGPGAGTPAVWGENIFLTSADGEDIVLLCIGTDGSVNPEAFIRFSLLSALSTANDPPEAAAKPFAKDRDGFVMAEGAAALVIESLESAKARGARILGVLAGCGEMADSFHRTRSSPDGKAIIGCIRNAITDAGLTPDDIDYVNPHGTGTPENDKMEYLGIMTVFGERAKSIPVSSNKSMVGHTLSAAGAVETVFTLLTLQHQRLPPTINYKRPDPAIMLDVVPNVARAAKVTHVLSNSFGFGGQNVSLVISGEPA